MDNGDGISSIIPSSSNKRKFNEVGKDEEIEVMTYVLKNTRTVIIVHTFGHLLFIVSDSRLSYGIVKDETTKDGVEKKVKKYAISFLPKPDGIRTHVEEVGEKIFTSENCTIALAGDYGEAHGLCKSLIHSKDVDHGYLVKELEKHYGCERPKAEKDHDTDFVVATPHTAIGKSFEITYVTPKKTEPIVKRTHCFGSGGELAEEFIDSEIKRRAPKSKDDVIHMLKRCVYHVSEKEEDNTVGGPVVVTIMEIDESGGESSKRFKTEIIRFPCYKKVWSVEVKEDGIYLLRDSFLQLVILKEVLNFNTIDEIVAQGALGNANEIGQDHVNVWVYKGEKDDLFYQSSSYPVEEDYTKRSLVLEYNKSCKSFTIGRGPNKFCEEELREYFDEQFQDFCNAIEEEGDAKMFWDNDQAAFVIWGVTQSAGARRNCFETVVAFLIKLFC